MIRDCRSKFICLFLLLTAVANAGNVQIAALNPPQVKSQAAKAPARTWNLKDLDLLTLIHQVSEETGKNFIVDPGVKGSVTMISNHPLSPDELYQVFLNILKVHGYTTIEDENAVNIIPMKDSKQTGIPVNFGYRRSGHGRAVVKIIHVEYVPVDELIKVLRPMIPKEGHIAAYKPTNDLIISDEGSNIDKISQIVERLDKSTNNSTEVIRLDYASADEVVNTITQLESNRNAKSSDPLKIAADLRTNSVIISGGHRERLHLRGLISELDRPVGDNGGSTQVIYLKFIRAEDLAPIISDLISNYLDQESSGAGSASSSSQSRSSNDRTSTRGSSRARLGSRISPNTGNSSGDSSLNISQRDIAQGPKSGSAGPAVQWKRLPIQLL